MQWQWRKRDASIHDLESMIEHNTGMSVYEFLHPQKDPYVKNLKEAADFVAQCVRDGLKIKIVGDYDTDGVLASTILKMIIEESSGETPEVRLPRRYSEGYGLSMKIIDETDSGLIITVDNGISAVEQIRKAKEKGIKVVILDHHLGPKDNILPPADIIVDPHIEDASEFKHYCGAGLAFRFAQEYLPDSRILTELEAFAGIATVADMMPLIGANRILVNESLDALNRRKVTLGLNVLLGLLNMTHVTEMDYGFKIGPIINASGRLLDDGPMDVVRFMSTHLTPEDEDYMSTVSSLEEQADELIERNEQRKTLERSSVSRMIDYIQKEGLQESSPLVVYDKECSEGIIGIVAGKLAEMFRVPTIVFTDSKEKGVLKGSARTFGEVNLWEMLCSASDCFEKFGGHKEAAGMSIKAEKLDEMRKRTGEYLNKTGYDRHKDEDVIYYDLDIKSEEISKYASLIRLYAPYGQGNPAPVFMIKNYKSSPRDGKTYKLMGKNKEHVKIYGNVDAIMFSEADRYTKEGSPLIMDMIGNLSQNFYNGKVYDQVMVTDFKKCKQEKSSTFIELQNLLSFV